MTRYMGSASDYCLSPTNLHCQLASRAHDENADLAGSRRSAEKLQMDVFGR